MFTIIPTLRGAILTGGTIIAFCVTMVNPTVSTALVTAAGIALLLTSLIFCCFSLSGIEINRDICIDGVKDEMVYLPLTIKNRTAHRRQISVLRESFGFSRNAYDEFPIQALLPFEERIAERYVSAVQRGRFKLNLVKLVGGDPAGLFQKIKTFKLPADLIIFPSIERISSIEMQTKNKFRSSVSGQPLSISGQGQDIFGLRDYRHGDPVRLVNWKVSARQRKLLVKEFEADGLNRISLLLDVDRRYVGKDKYANNFEYLVKSAASIIHYLSGMYCHTSFITASEKDKSILYEKGSASRISGVSDSILAEIQPFDMNLREILEESLSIIPDDSIFYCLTMSANEDIYQYFDVLSARGIEIRWFFAPPECFPKIIPGMEQKEPDTALFGYGMYSPAPFILKRSMELEDAIF